MGHVLKSLARIMAAVQNPRFLGGYPVARACSVVGGESVDELHKLRKLDECHALCRSKGSCACSVTTRRWGRFPPDMGPGFGRGLDALPAEGMSHVTSLAMPKPSKWSAPSDLQMMRRSTFGYAHARIAPLTNFILYTSSSLVRDAYDELGRANAREW